MYFVTTAEEIDEYGTKGTRCVGYFSNLEDAKKVVLENRCDIFEYCYTYAIIENIPEGLYQYDNNPLWFQWCEKENRYKEIVRPEEYMKNIVGIAIG